jgi:hypothetical protein
LFRLLWHGIFAPCPKNQFQSCEKFEADLQSELVKHSSKLDALSKRIGSQEEAMKQFQSDLRKDIQDLIRLADLNKKAINNSALSQPERNEYEETMARLDKRYVP